MSGPEIAFQDLREFYEGVAATSFCKKFDIRPTVTFDATSRIVRAE